MLKLSGSEKLQQLQARVEKLESAPYLRMKDFQPKTRDKKVPKGYVKAPYGYSGTILEINNIPYITLKQKKHFDDKFSGRLD